MQHYDVFAWVYEYGTEKLHGRHRIAAIDLLRLRPNASVLDVPTGTGANLPLLIERIGPSGRVVGVDASRGMLARARKKGDFIKALLAVSGFAYEGTVPAVMQYPRRAVSAASVGQESDGLPVSTVEPVEEETLAA